jgi:DMSO reductase anchor subunit
MATIRLSRDIGPIAAAVFFILLGLYFLGVVGPTAATILGIMALIAGILQLIELA